MPEPEVPQPITREEFEAGVKFYHSPQLKKFDDMDHYYKEESYIVESDCIGANNHYYCSIDEIEDDGFTFFKTIFGHPNEFKVFFNNCYKLPNR